MEWIFEWPPSRIAEFSGRTRGPASSAQEKRIFDSRQEAEKVLLAGFYVDNLFFIRTLSGTNTTFKAKEAMICIIQFLYFFNDITASFDDNMMNFSVGLNF